MKNIIIYALALAFLSSLLFVACDQKETSDLTVKPSAQVTSKTKGGIGTKGQFCVYTISVVNPVNGANPGYQAGDKVCFSCPMKGDDIFTICRVDNANKEFEVDHMVGGVKEADVTLTLTGGNGCITCPVGAHRWKQLNVEVLPKN